MIGTKIAASLALCLAVAGCGTWGGGAVNIGVPIPVECREPTPPRPTMPTETLSPGVALDSFVKASQAEIEIREGYEAQLRTALAACTAPLKTAP